MSNKPKVYATCDAGCRWQVPHMSDLEAHAAFIKQSTVNGHYVLEAGKTYKVKSAHTNGVYCRIEIDWHIEESDGKVRYPSSYTTDYLPHPMKPDEEYCDGVLFRFCGAKFNTDFDDTVVAHYLKEDGDLIFEASTKDISDFASDIDHLVVVVDEIRLLDATECLLVNDKVQSVAGITSDNIGDGLKAEGDKIGVAIGHGLSIDEDGAVSVGALIPNDIDIVAGDAVTVEIVPDRNIYYTANTGAGGMTITGDVTALPRGYVGFITFMNMKISEDLGAITSDILEETSLNGKTLSDIGLSLSVVIMVAKAYNNVGEEKLCWYYFC